MIDRIALYEGVSNDPYYNLAVEQYLLESVEEGQCILYLWQNQNTVVIGRNQNPWKECRTTLLSQEGGHLARRLSGGGAVFHDLGNLNFTFLMPQSDYDLERQLTVIQEGVRSLGIPAEKSGRNDIQANGRKFSGNAFYKNGKQAYHHGTLLVSADMEKLSRYLNPSKAKLQAKGVDSVRSRVMNLTEMNPAVSMDILKSALVEAFSRTYGRKPHIIRESDLDSERIRELTARNRSWEWNYGQKLPFTFECEDRFPWGSAQVQLQIENGLILDARVYSDGMDWAFASEICDSLKGVRLDKTPVEAAVRRSGAAEAADICDLIINNL